MWRYRPLSADWSAHASAPSVNQTRSRIGQNDRSFLRSPAANTISKAAPAHAHFGCGAMLFQEDRGLNRNGFNVAVGTCLAIDNDLEVRSVGIVHAALRSMSQPRMT